MNIVPSTDTLLKVAERIANEKYDGHLHVFKCDMGWAVLFGISKSSSEIVWGTGGEYYETAMIVPHDSLHEALLYSISNELDAVECVVYTLYEDALVKSGERSQYV